MDSSTIRSLNKLGFQVEKGRKHCRIYRGNDTSHCFFISTTASDRKTGANAASMIYRYLVKDRETSI